MAGLRSMSFSADRSAANSRIRERGWKRGSGRGDRHGGIAERGKRGVSSDARLCFHRLPRLAVLAPAFPDVPLIEPFSGVLGIGRSMFENNAPVDQRGYAYGVGWSAMKRSAGTFCRLPHLA